MAIRCTWMGRFFSFPTFDRILRKRLSQILLITFLHDYFMSFVNNVPQSQVYTLAVYLLFGYLVVFTWIIFWCFGNTFSLNSPDHTLKRRPGACFLKVQEPIFSMAPKAILIFTPGEVSRFWIQNNTKNLSAKETKWTCFSVV